MVNRNTRQKTAKVVPREEEEEAEEVIAVPEPEEEPMISDEEKDPEWSPDLELLAEARKSRISSTKRRLKRRFPGNKRKRHDLSISVRHINANLSTRNVSISANGRENVLRIKNRALAQALNARLVENQELSQYIHELRRENLELNFEKGELKKKVEDLENGLADYDREALESEFQKRLVDYLDPVKHLMNRVLDHTCGLSDELSKAMQLVSAPGRRSRSAALSAGKLHRKTLPIPDSSASKQRNSSNVAHVSPRVNGHAIHKPQIEIQRLDPDEIQRLQGQPTQDVHENGVEHSEAEDEDHDDVEEEEPLAPHHSQQQDEEENQEILNRMRESRRNARQNNAGRMSIIGENTNGQEEESETDNEEEEAENEEEEEEVLGDREERNVSKRRNRWNSTRSSLSSLSSPVVLLNDLFLSDLNLQQHNDGGEEENSADDSDESENGSERNDKQYEMLVPRLVLDRVKVTERNGQIILPRSPSSAKQRNGSNMSTPSKTPPKLMSRSPSLNNSCRRLSPGMVISPCTTSTKRSGSAPRRNSNGRSPSSKRSLSSALENSDTPTSRESTDQFVVRLFEEDPMEGPSWLFGDNNKAKRSKIAKEILERTKRSSITFRAKNGDCSKKLNLSNSAETNREEEDSTPASPAEPPTPNPISGNKKESDISIKEDEQPTATVKKVRKRKHRTVHFELPPSTSSTPHVPELPPVPTSSSSAPTTPVKSPSKTVETPSSSAEMTSRPKRRAAAAATTSLKEPSLNKKMRRGDPLSKSIYSKDTVEVEDNNKNKSKRKNRKQK